MPAQQRTQDDTRAAILNAAKKEFLEKGFRGASVRKIAGEVGISAAALYWHFENKEALFDALVEPTLAALKKYSKTLEQQDHDVLGTLPEKSVNGSDKDILPAELDNIWDSGFYDVLLNFVYADLTTFRLLITASGGTKYEHFLEDIVRLETEGTLAVIRRAAEKGLPVNLVSPEELDIFMELYVTSMFEPIRRGLSKEQAKAFLDHHKAFFTAAFRSYLNF